MDLKCSPAESQRPDEPDARPMIAAIMEQVPGHAPGLKVSPTQKACNRMRIWTAALRCLSLLALAIWLGGFTFYSAVVIPILHDELGSQETGYVTQRVTDTLNSIGVAALLVAWTWTAFDSRASDARRFRLRLGLLATSSAILIFQIALHRVMDRHLDREGLRGFYPLHRVYLLASTLQWLINAALLPHVASVRRDGPGIENRAGREK